MTFRDFLNLFLSPFMTTTTLYTMASGQPCQRDHIGDSTKRVHYKGRLQIDDDGSGPSGGDPDFQPRTSLRVNGRSLDAETEPYGVIYERWARPLPEIVLGCQGRVTHLASGCSVAVVAGDVGPGDGWGEGSEAVATEFRKQGVNISSSPTRGGDSGLHFLWEWFPGTPAVLSDGTECPLQRL